MTEKERIVTDLRAGLTIANTLDDDWEELQVALLRTGRSRPRTKKNELSLE